jgi:hypothetical protein
VFQSNIYPMAMNQSWNLPPMNESVGRSGESSIQRPESGRQNTQRYTDVKLVVAASIQNFGKSELETEGPLPQICRKSTRVGRLAARYKSLARS